MSLLRLNQFRFGKEFELSNKADEVFAVSTNKEYDGSGPFEFKTPVLNIYQAIVFNYYIRRMLSWDVLFKYYIREGDEGELEEKGNHLHFTILKRKLNIFGDDIKEINWKKTKAFGVLAAIMLLTPLRRLLTMRLRFRNTLFKWNYFVINYDDLEERNYTAVTTNFKRGKKTIEIRISEGGLGNDLHFINFTLMVYNLYSNLIRDFDNFLLSLLPLFSDLEKKGGFIGIKDSTLNQAYRLRLDSVDFLKKFVEYVKENGKNNIFIEDLEKYVKQSIKVEFKRKKILVNSIFKLYLILEERCASYKHESKDLDKLFNLYFDNMTYNKVLKYIKSTEIDKTNFLVENIEAYLFTLFKLYLNNSFGRDILDSLTSSKFIMYLRDTNNYNLLNKLNRQMKNIFWEIFVE